MNKTHPVANHLSEDRVPERWFATGAIGFFLISLPCYFFYPNTAVDFQFHDTYLVLALFHIPLLSAACLMVQGLIYFCIRKADLFLIVSLAKAHFVLIALPLFFLVLAAFNCFPFRNISPQGLGQMAWACLASILLAFFMFLCNVSLLVVWKLIEVIGEKRQKNRSSSRR